MRYIFSLIFLLLSVAGASQCEVHITPGSSTVIDHNPGISFVFEVQNDSDTPYLGGDLYLNWALSGGASGPIFGFDFGVFSFFKISSASSEDLPQTPQDEFVKKSFLILEIFTFLELLRVTSILF